MQDQKCQILSHKQLYSSVSKHWRTLLQHCYFQEAIFNIQSYIEHCPTQQFDFFGIGNREEKEGVCFESQISWYYSEISNNQKINNPHDLLSWAVSCLNNCESAISWYQKMLQLHPSCYKLHHGLANACYNTHRYSLSQLHYKQATRINPLFVRGYICLAWIALSHYQEIELAFRLASTALALNQYDFYARLIVGQFNQDSQKSLQIITALSKTHICNPLILCAKAFRIYMQEQKQQRKNDAMQLIGQALSIDQNMVQSYILLAALSRFSDGQNDEAQKLLKQVVQSRSRKNQRHILYCKLAESYYFGKQYIEAFTYFKKSLEMNEEDNVSLYYIGCIYYDVFLPPRIQSAIQYLKKSITINPRQNKSYEKLRKIYKECGDPDKAESLYVEELSFKVKVNEKIKSLIAQILKYSNYRDQAQQLIYQQVKKHEEAESLSQYLAQRYFSVKLWKSSIRQLRFCLQLNPYNLGCLQKIVRLYRSEYKRQELHKYIVDYLNGLKCPIDPKNACSIIATMFRLVMSEQVVESLERISISGNQLEFKLILANYYKKIGNFESQIKIYQEIKQNERSLDFQDEKERDNYFGRNSKWLQLKTLGIYSKRQQIGLFLNKDLFEKRFKQLLEEKS